ncbi:MAG: hypothetical protein ACYSPJ_02405, partial [Planctomycetota bacterium]
MFKKFLSMFGAGAMATSTMAAPYHSPYSKKSTNLVYNLLFCDNLELFKSSENEKDSSLWKPLLSAEFDFNALNTIIQSEESDSRIKILAYWKLHKNKHIVQEKLLLGVVVEVPTNGGLDVLATFNDKSARYINHSEKMAIVEGTPNPFEKLSANVLSTSESIVKQIGPWEEKRLPPPEAGNIRF